VQGTSTSISNSNNTSKSVQNLNDHTHTIWPYERHIGNHTIRKKGSNLKYIERYWFHKEALSDNQLNEKKRHFPNIILDIIIKTEIP
jgi:hypothetical protein